ncbi:MAG: glycoside hydrolase family 2 TIM barrel-domain containing protein, partial [Jiangellaceae bacterium]
LILEVLPDGADEPIETFLKMVGFRAVEATRGPDGNVTIDGQPVNVRGTNRHEADPDTGRTVPLDTLKRDFELLKRFNCNAVRTSHYPNDPTFYRLADEYGVSVMDEVNVETHWWEGVLSGTTAYHDAAVALVSHAPHVVAALMAGRMLDAPDHEVRLAGQGVSDVTRVAAGDPALWTEILTSNSAAVAQVLRRLRGDLDRVLEALESEGGPALGELLAAGADGRARLPGKHGEPHVEYATVAVVVDDRPGQLAALFADAGAAGVNIEDVRIEHSPGQPMGTVELDVRPEAGGELAAGLRKRGWTVHE